MGARRIASGDGAAGDYVLGPGFAATPFVVATAWLESGVPVVSVTGELDPATAPVLEEALLGLSDGAVGAVILDLSGCSVIDLGGLRVLLAARERLQRADRTLALVLGNPSLLLVFELTRVLGLFEIYPSLADAVKVNSRG